LANGTALGGLKDLNYRRLKTPGRLTDPARPGFIMVAGHRGKRWMYRSQAGGKQRQITLGRYPDMSLEDARIAWAKVSSEGITAADKRGEAKLGPLVAEYLQTRSKARTYARLEKVLKANTDPDMRIRDVTAEVLEDRYEHLIHTSPGAARNIRTRLNAFMAWAEVNKRLPLGATAPKLRAVGRANIKEFFPSDSELRTALKAFTDMGVVGDLIEFQLLTGVRISEAREADWSEIADDRWVIPGSRMKNGHNHVVMLSRAAKAILDRQSSTTGLIFGSLGHSSVMTAWRDQRAALGLPQEYGTHTHRKALLTWIAEQGGGVDIRNRLSAHHDSSSVDSHYMRSELNKPAAEWWQRWGDHVEALRSANVVELRA
jgi:integrase